MTKFILSIALAVGLIGSAAAADIKIVVPFGAGGIADQAARTVEKILAQNTQHNYTVEYRTGAGGSIGARYVASNTESETVLLVHSASVVLQSLIPTPAYLMKDFVPVANIGSIQWLLITNKDSNVNTLNKLITVKEPIFFGSSGTGTTNHIAGQMLGAETKQNLIGVPFKGEAPAFAEVLGNRLQLLFAGSGLVKGHTDVTVLAVSGPKRHADYPSVPTLTEAGIKGFDTNLNWLVLLANPGADTTVIKEIQTALADALKDPEQTRVLTTAGVDVEINNPNTKQFLETEENKLRKFVK